LLDCRRAGTLLAHQPRLANTGNLSSAPIAGDVGGVMATMKRTPRSGMFRVHATYTTPQRLENTLGKEDGRVSRPAVQENVPSPFNSI